MTMIWANFLHFYQPPTQKKYWVDLVTEESYRRIVKELLTNPEVRLTLNVNAVLCDLWLQYGHNDVISGIKGLVQRGQIELTGSAKFHPLLPKLPKEEIRRQIRLNEEGLFNYFGVLPPIRRGGPGAPPQPEQDSYESGVTLNLRGFFPPEMAYDRYVAEVVAEMGYAWILAEELSYSQKLGEVKSDRVYEVSGLSANRTNPFYVFFRDRNLSWRILSGQLGTPNLFVQALGDRVNNNEYLLTAMDGETFGHHRPGMEKQLFEVYRGSGLKSATISELPSLFPKREATETLPSTWALMEYEVSVNKPFSRWDEPVNAIHQLQWELTNLAIKTVEAVENGALTTDSSARTLLDKALHSDQYWWASARPWWSLEMIERGAYELLASIKAARGSSATDEVVKQAQDLYLRILTTGFEWQRSGKVDELARQEDETVRMLTDAGMPNLPPEEIDKMIATIRKELKKVVQSEEYERAVQLRNRIRELEGYKCPIV